MSQFRNWQVDVVVSLTGCEKTASFKLRVEKEEKKTTSCIFVILEGSLFFFVLALFHFLFSCILECSLEMLPRILLFIMSDLGGMCAEEWGLKKTESVSKWRSALEPDRAKAISQTRTWYLRLCRRLHLQSCRQLLLQNPPKVTQPLCITLFKIPLVASYTWGAILIRLFDYDAAFGYLCLASSVALRELSNTQRESTQIRCQLISGQTFSLGVICIVHRFGIVIACDPF